MRAAGTLLLALALLGACAREPRPPDILLISVDTLRPDRLGCYGHERETSPTIDRLAAEGVLFEDVTSASPWTLPSHASMLTGRYPSRHGVKDHVNRLAPSIPTLATLLAARGYRTLGVVNSHNLSERYGLDQGFQHFEYVVEYGAQGGIPNRGKQVVAAAWELLEAHARDDSPFFLFLHFYDVHTDLRPLPEHRERLVAPYEGSFDGTTAQLIALREENRTLAESDARHLLELYDAELRTFDDLLGELLEELEREGFLEHTLLVLTSDHGEEFGEHGSVLHGRTYFDEVIRIPLIARGPGLPQGLRVAAPVHLIDVAPTLLTAAGAELPAGLDGVDLGSLWRRPGSALPGRLMFAEADHNNAEPDAGRMLRAARHKLIYDRLSGRSELYDLGADPRELDELAAREAALTETLLEQLERFMQGSIASEAIDAPDEEMQRRLRELGY